MKCLLHILESFDGDHNFILLPPPPVLPTSCFHRSFLLVFLFGREGKQPKSKEKGKYGLYLSKHVNLDTCTVQTHMNKTRN